MNVEEFEKFIADNGWKYACNNDCWLKDDMAITVIDDSIEFSQKGSTSALTFSLSDTFDEEFLKFFL